MTTAGTGALTGRTVVVTGGGGHLGRAMALEAARAGAAVVVCGRRLEALEDVGRALREERAPGAGEVIPVQADVSTDEGLDRVVRVAVDRTGGLHGWVNNAYGARASLLGSLTRRDVEETLARGLGDVMIATQVAAAAMPDGGSIVNVASMYGIVSPQPAAYDAHPGYHNPPAYGAAKAGVISFTRYAAVHLADASIRVNALAPGPFPSGAAGADEAFVDELSARVPLGRVGRPAELGPAAVFLLGDGSSYVTGHTLVVDGGWTVW